MGSRGVACPGGGSAQCSALCPKPNGGKKDDDKNTIKPAVLDSKCPIGLKAAPARCSDGSTAICKAACPEGRNNDKDRVLPGSMN